MLAQQQQRQGYMVPVLYTKPMSPYHNMVPQAPPAHEIVQAIKRKQSFLIQKVFDAMPFEDIEKATQGLSFRQDSISPRSNRNLNFIVPANRKSKLMGSLARGEDPLAQNLQQMKLPVLNGSPGGHQQQEDKITNQDSIQNSESKVNFQRFINALNFSNQQNASLREGGIYQGDKQQQIQQYKLYIHQLINQASTIATQNKLGIPTPLSPQEMNFASYHEIMTTQSTAALAVQQQQNQSGYHATMKNTMKTAIKQSFSNLKDTIQGKGPNGTIGFFGQQKSGFLSRQAQTLKNSLRASAESPSESPSPIKNEAPKGVNHQSKPSESSHMLKPGKFMTRIEPEGDTCINESPSNKKITRTRNECGLPVKSSKTGTMNEAGVQSLERDVTEMGLNKFIGQKIQNRNVLQAYSQSAQVPTPSGGSQKAPKKVVVTSLAEMLGFRHLQQQARFQNKQSPPQEISNAQALKIQQNAGNSSLPRRPPIKLIKIGNGEVADVEGLSNTNVAAIMNAISAQNAGQNLMYATDKLPSKSPLRGYIATNTQGIPDFPRKPTGGDFIPHHTANNGFAELYNPMSGLFQINESLELVRDFQNTSPTLVRRQSSSHQNRYQQHSKQGKQQTIEKDRYKYQSQVSLPMGGAFTPQSTLKLNSGINLAQTLIAGKKDAYGRLTPATEETGNNSVFMQKSSDGLNRAASSQLTIAKPESTTTSSNNNNNEDRREIIRRQLNRRPQLLLKGSEAQAASFLIKKEETNVWGRASPPAGGCGSSMQSSQVQFSFSKPTSQEEKKQCEQVE